MKRKPIIRLCVICVLALLYVGVFTFSYTFSGYTSTVPGSDTVTVAAVAGSVSSAMLDVSGVSPVAHQSFQFTVTNTEARGTSDVSLSYSISVSSAGNLPLNISLVKAGSGSTQGDSLTRQGSSNVWTGGTLAHSVGETDTYNLIVSWNTEVAGYDNPSYTYEIDKLTVSVLAMQTD